MQKRKPKQEGISVFPHCWRKNRILSLDWEDPEGQGQQTNKQKLGLYSLSGYQEGGPLHQSHVPPLWGGGTAPGSEQLLSRY